MNKLVIFKIFAVCTCFLTLSAWSSPLLANDWKPNRPVAFIVGTAAGGALDLTARLLQKIWDDSKIVNSPVVVINKPGAGNGIAWSYLNARGADGHAIAISTTNLVSNPVMGTHSIGHRNVTPLAILFDDYFIFLVRTDSPIKTLSDVKERLIKDPAALSIGVGAGLGAGGHTAGAVVLKSMGIDASKGRFIPYRSTGEAIVAMLGGEIDIVSGTSVNAPSFITAGRVRGIGVLAPERLGSVLSVVPTVKEQGLNASFTNWRGVIGPQGMRKEHTAFWVKSLSDATRSELWQQQLIRNYWKHNFLTGNAVDKFLEQQAALFQGLWGDMGAKGKQAQR